MANEKRLIDANALMDDAEMDGALYACLGAVEDVRFLVDIQPTVDTVEVEKYKALVEMYHDLRENFIDYVCSGSPNVAPYCLNRCQECADHYGWCKKDSVYCKGFNPAEVILDGERKDNE